MPIPSLAYSARLKHQSTKSDRDSSTAASTTRALPCEPSPDPGLPGENRSPTRLPLPSISLQQPEDGSKRRNFLPQREAHNITASKIGLGDGTIPRESIHQDLPRKDENLGASASNNVSRATGINTTKANRSRPLSMYQKGLTAEIQGRAQERTSTRSLRQRDDVRKTSMSSHTELSRSQSSRRPVELSGTTNPSNARVHSRNLSTNTTTNFPKPQISLKREIQRPKALSVDLSRPPHNNGQTAKDGDATGNRSSQRVAVLKRPTSTKAKLERYDSPDSAATTDSDQSMTSFNASRHKEPVRDDLKRQARPAFSTLQQHFTPRKTGKAPTSTFIHPSVPDPSTNNMSTDIISLQGELLQLHLLHEASSQTWIQWESSAQRALHRKFDDVASAYQVMRENERRLQEQVNLCAMKEWTSGASSFGLAENIQLLSVPLHELPSLSDPGGRFARLAEDFTKWMGWVEEIWHSREAGVNGVTGNLKYAEGLGDAWKAENAALHRKLTVFSRDLEALTEPTPGSSVASIVASCRAMLKGMLEELQIMQAIERDVMERERLWIEEGLQAIAQDIGAHLVERQEGREVWRQ